MDENRLRTATTELYTHAAHEPDRTLCCVGSAPYRARDLVIPPIMEEMNYGCGSCVAPADVPPDGTVLYLGVGGGLELLGFAHLTRRPHAVIGIDTVDAMLERCRQNIEEAARLNPWFSPDFIDLRRGDALDLPVDDASVQVVAQNCLYNIFEDEELDRALQEAHRVLAPGGRLVLSDPICETPLPPSVREDPQLRAACLSGALPLRDYTARLTKAGFGVIEIRSRRPYRALVPGRHAVEQPILLETIEAAAVKSPLEDDGPCVFTGRCAIYMGEEEFFDDGRGHRLRRDLPLEVCDKTAAALASIGGDDLIVTPPTWHYQGGGCC